MRSMQMKIPDAHPLHTVVRYETDGGARTGFGQVQGVTTNLKGVSYEMSNGDIVNHGDVTHTFKEAARVKRATRRNATARKATAKPATLTPNELALKKPPKTATVKTKTKKSRAEF